MMLLSFTVRNHKSIRDEISLDFVRPSLRTLRPRDDEQWKDQIYPLVGVFGANASGKSSVLDAILYAFSAIRDSSTLWLAERTMYRAPFALDVASIAGPSRYELDFVHAGRRFAYGFEVDAAGISREWLRDVPSQRWRTLLERDRRTDSVRTHATIRAIGPVSPRELALSRARVIRHAQLAPIADDLVGSFDFVSVKDVHRERRLEYIADALMDGSLTFDDIVRLLQVADIGVEQVTVVEEDLPKKFRDAMKDFRQALLAEGSESPEQAGAISAREHGQSSLGQLDDDESDAVVRSLLFRHRGASGDGPSFSIRDESDGTVAWLGLAVPAIEVLRKGGLYCVDEIDSSLHPHLLDVLLGMFSDPALNVHGAQLVFTSHETHILSPLSEVDLEPEQIWFTDKTPEGVTVLSCLADFPRHRDANVAKRYLLGRYGGTPRLAPATLTALVEAKATS